MPDGPHKTLALHGDIRAAKGGDLVARTRILVSHAGWLRANARRWLRKWNEVELEDLEQEGFMALSRAIDKFNPFMGTTFSTYARLWVDAYMRRWISKVRSFAGNVRERKKAKDPYPAKVSMDVPSGRGSDEPLVETLAGEAGPLEQRLSARDARLIVRRAVAEIGFWPRDLEVLERRMLADDPESQESLARHFGVSRARITQYEKRILEMLRAEIARQANPAAGRSSTRESDARPSRPHLARARS